MSTHPFRWLLSAGLFCSCAVFCTQVQANELKKVDQVLATEAAGKPIDRRQALADQTDEASQWQAGRILIDGQWLGIEDLENHKLGSKANAYVQERDTQMNLDEEGHRHMAKWCQSHQLPEMALVHWKAILNISPDDDQARKALNHKKVGDNWVTKDELKQLAADQKQEKASLAEWMPQVRKIVNKLQSSGLDKKLEGMQELEKIDTASAVASLKYGAMQLPPSTALPIVGKIKSIRSKDSCLALCEIALIDPTSEVGRLAIEGLQEYDERFYVPELLQLLEVSLKVKQECVYLPNGALAIRGAFIRETANLKEQVQVLKLVMLEDSARFAAAPTPPTKVSSVHRPDGSYSVTVEETLSMPIVVYAKNAQATDSAQKLSRISIRNEQRKAESWNVVRSQHEKNAKYILSMISGLPADQSAEAYWSWWPAFNETATNQKATAQSYVLDSSETISLPTTGVGTLQARTSRTTEIPRNHSCLVAGTLVQTSEGPKNVESIRVGDFVTSISVDTGKISLCPATQITLRTADSTYTFSLASGETIRATGGHSWWVVGKGWVRSRDLKVGQFMRTGDSSVEITKVEKIDEPIKVYNMIVDENHTYFVGKDRLLSWDVTSLQPTLQTAPGQVQSVYVSKK